MVRFKVIDLANLFGVHRNSITNWIKKGTLKAKPIVGRKYVISKEDLLSFAEKNGLSADAVKEFIEKNSVSDEFVQDKILENRRKVDNRDISSKPINTGGVVAMTNSKPIGSVLVVGGGIAGIQTVLDLADSGYFVHLVERSAGIGGVMAQLDKTFPTNDCAM